MKSVYDSLQMREYAPRRLVKAFKFLMIVGLLAQAGCLSTMLRILILENHELVDGDWKEKTI